MEMTDLQNVSMGDISARHRGMQAADALMAEEWRGMTEEPLCRLPDTLSQCAARRERESYSIISSLTRCQCDKFCAHFGDCCHDAVSNSSTMMTMPKEVGLQCVSTESYGADFEGIGFYLISSCPSNGEWADVPSLMNGSYSMADVMSQCLHVGLNDTLAKIPVQIEDRAYRNVFCALCHGEEVRPEHFWELSTKGDMVDLCQDYLHRFQQSFTDFNYSIGLCQTRSIAYPQTNPLQGLSRMGKMCFFDPRHPAEVFLSEPVALIMHFDRVEAVAADCFCQHCSARMMTYANTRVERLYRFVENFSQVELMKDRNKDVITSSGEVINLFRPPHDDDDNDDDDDNNGAEEGTGVVLRVASLTGSGASIISLTSVAFHVVFVEGVTSRAKRCQVGILISKWVFYLCLCGGTTGRNVFWACKIFAVLTHYFMLVSFSHMMWFGTQVARMMWLLNSNMAVLSRENWEETRIGVEVLYFLGLWMGPGVLVGAVLCLEHFYDDNLFQYGHGQNCVLSGPSGTLYFVIVPVSVMVLVNVSSLAFSAIQWYKLWDDKMDQSYLTKLIKFFGKLMTFQSFQWILGVVFYWTENEALKYAFEILVAYEGLFIALSYFSGKCICQVECVKA